MSDVKETIAKIVAKFFKDGDVVNLGIGLPTLVAKYIEDGVLLHTENGLIGYGPAPEPGKEDQDFSGAGGQFLTLKPAASAFDHATSFAIVRGGHLTATVLGTLEVDGHGNLANWSLPGRLMGMGGAMDLVVGAKQVIVVTEHVNKNGQPKILKECKLPLTGSGVVTNIVTELCVLDVTKNGLVVHAMAVGITKEELQAKTEAPLIFPDVIDTIVETA
jgi:acetate CoA/acetoacetate CoA-transferase beta subunit